jgi:hypothetical protein
MLDHRHFSYRDTVHFGHLRAPPRRLGHLDGHPLYILDENMQLFNLHKHKCPTLDTDTKHIRQPGKRYFLSVTIMRHILQCEGRIG